MSELTQSLRNNVCVKAISNVWKGYQTEGGKDAFRSGVKLCLDRARLMTESYKETEREAMVLRRAKSLKKILEEMTIYIEDGEQIVGNFASDPQSVTYYPEFYWRWLEKATDNGYSSILDDEGRKELKEINNYWKGLSVHGREIEYLPEDVKPYWRYNGAFIWNYYYEVGVPNYKKIFKVGLKGVIEEAQKRLKEIDEDTTMKAKDYIDQRDFLHAVIISLDAAITFGKRFSAMAKEKAEAATDETSRQKLANIAEVCSWVPKNPPRTFHEALQFFWFIHLITHVIEDGMVGCGVRFDQLMYPFYKKDVEQGRITRERAQELVEFLWLKFEEQGHLHPPIWTGIGAGGNLWQTLDIGGITPTGEDATNEVSYIVLDAAKSMQTLQPPLALRYHDRIPKDLVLKAIDVLHTGMAQPAIFNDNYMIPMLLARGIPLEEARDYAVEGCMVWTIPGKNMVYRSSIGMMMLPKCLELALNQGVDKFSGQRIGIPTPDPSTFTSVEDVMEAYLDQVKLFGEKLVRINNTADVLYEEYLPRPFMSGLLDGCIEKGQDCRKWTYHYKQDINVLGPTNVADSLAAMKKLVFEEKKITMEELLDALKNNFEGKEDIRQMLLNEAPKFGNDIDEVDLLARDVHKRTKDVLGELNGYFGKIVVDGSGASANYTFGFDTGATPDGRKDREPYADATLSPVGGRDTHGPTAVLKSTSKVDPMLTYNHLLNQKFMPQYLEGPYREVFADYLKTWADLGHHHIQFNIVDKQSLLDAQENPEKHSNLIVRVAGYSAYFIDLSKGLQDDIIKRTEQCF